MTDQLSVPGLLLNLVSSYIHKNQIRHLNLIALLKQYEGKARVPMQFWWNILETVHDTHPVPALGHCIGKEIEPYHIHVLGYLALSSPNLYTFATCFKNFQPILQNSAEFSIYIKNSHFAMTWTAVIQKSTQTSNEVLISGTMNILRKMLHRQDINPIKVEFTAPEPVHNDVYSAIYGCPVIFNSDALRLWLPIDILYLTIPSLDPYLKALLDQQAIVLLNALPNPDTFLKNIQDLIVDQLKTGEPTAENIADTLNIPLRTFYRKLTSYNLQYSELVRKIRLELAKNYLENSKMSLTEISFLLGYAEQSAFSRAFKQWENISPSEYRKMHLIPT